MIQNCLYLYNYDPKLTNDIKIQGKGTLIRNIQYMFFFLKVSDRYLLVGVLVLIFLPS